MVLCSRCLLIGVALMSVAGNPPANPGHKATPVLTRVADAALPGPAVRFDYQSADTAANRLYLSHMNAGELVVFDLEHRKVVATVNDLPRVTGVWGVPGRVRLATQSTIRARATVSVDPRTHLVYFPLQDVDGHPLLRIMTAESH